MNCPNAHVLSRYYDEMLVGEEYRQMTQHVLSCEACQRVMSLCNGEERFIKATLREPKLPIQFVEDVLREVKSRKELVLLVIALGLFITVLLSTDFVS